MTTVSLGLIFIFVIVCALGCMKHKDGMSWDFGFDSQLCIVLASLLAAFVSLLLLNSFSELAQQAFGIAFKDYMP